MRLHFIIIFSRICTLGGARNEQDFIWNYAMFVLTTEHSTSIFKLKNASEVVK
jgi:hypothetical protein